MSQACVKHAQYVLGGMPPLPGRCMPLKGDAGFVTVQLSRAIIPTAVTLAHVPHAIAFDVSTAPSLFSVVALSPMNARTSRQKGLPGNLLGTFKFDAPASGQQTFILDAQMPLETIAFQVDYLPCLMLVWSAALHVQRIKEDNACLCNGYELNFASSQTGWARMSGIAEWRCQVLACITNHA